MSNIQTISELCGICEALVHIVEEQRKALAQHDALVLEARRFPVGEVTAAQSPEKGKPPGNQCHNNCFGHGVYLEGFHKPT